MDTTKLRPDTLAVWQKLDAHPALRGFVLIGGTALTMRIGHRISEDLDFAFPRNQLPVRQIEALLRSAQAEGLHFQPNQNPLAEEDFLNAGMELKNYQQDYLVSGSVKVTFFGADHELIAILGQDTNAGLRVATMDEIFASKCLVCADRSKTRDWFDLYVLMNHHGYAMEDLYRVFERVNALPKYDIASTRLRNGVPMAADEGFESLLESPPGIEQMRAFFSEQLDLLEKKIAYEVQRKMLGELSAGIKL